ncbi:MAG: FAD-dependent oxidoreductase [Chloroflexi bacterium]|nr:FAD-dependent oxidoreductase [Chloroflexota bacterium]
MAIGVGGPNDQDVLVIGAGAAGLTAAIAAVESGARTTVLEKAPDISNTNTSRSGGVIMIERYDSTRLSAVEKAQEAMNITGGRIDPELIVAWRQSIDDTVGWLTSVGLRWGKGLDEGTGKVALGWGAGLNKQLLSIAEDKGCRILFSTRAEKLLTDSLGGISGTRARTASGMQDFSAKAVVLATAGFQANQEMLLQYFGPEFAYGTRLTGSPFSTGDGHLMARDAGAKLVGMDQCHCRNIDGSWVPGSTGMPGPYRELQEIVHYCIWVNKLGRRFMDEVASSDSAANSIPKQPGQTMAYIFDEKIKAMRPGAVERFPHTQLIIKGNTLEEIAAGIEVPSGELGKTIDDFNNAVQDGRALGLDVPKTNLAVRIDTPPFYAVYPVWSGLNCTLGGPKINPGAQVMDRDEVPIPGLFAAGEMIGGFYSGRYHSTKAGTTYYQGNYQITTACLSTCVVFGRIAGCNAARWSKNPQPPHHSLTAPGLIDKV